MMKPSCSAPEKSTMPAHGRDPEFLTYLMRLSLDVTLICCTWQDPFVDTRCLYGRQENEVLIPDHLAVNVFVVIPMEGCHTFTLEYDQLTPESWLVSTVRCPTRD